jgi:hypothetical protein
MKTIRLLSFVCLAMACQSPAPKSEDTPKVSASTLEPPPAPEHASTCDATALEAELQSFCEFDLGVPPIDLAKVGWTGPSYHPLSTRVITLDLAGLTDPEGGGTVSVEAWLADPPRRIPEPGELVVAIHRYVPYTTVAELQRGLAAKGRREVQYLVHPSERVAIPKPRDPKLLAELRDGPAGSTNERINAVIRGVQEYGKMCPPVAGVFPELEMIPPGERCPKLGELAAKAIVECGCTDVDSIMTLLYALMVGVEPPRARTIAMTITLEQINQAVPPPPAAVWGEFAAGFTGPPE